MTDHRHLNEAKTAAARHSSEVVLQVGYQSFLRSIADELAGLDPRDWPDCLPDGTTAQDRERVMQMAMHALANSPGDFDAARDAFVRAIRKDPGAMWALFEHARREAINAILARASRKLREDKPLMGRAGTPLEPRQGAARAPSVGVIAKVAMASLLDTFKIAGRPLGDVTVEEARVWSKRRKRDALFVEMLTDNLPAHDVIRSRRTAEDARRIFEEAANA